MKVLLISANRAQTPYPIYPLGVSMIAGALKNAGHDVTLFDFLQHEEDLDAVDATVRQHQPDLIGISIRNIDNVNLLNEERYIDSVAAIVEHIRATTDAKIVLGGSGFSIMPERILKKVGADYGIVGEGEVLMTEFVARAANGEYPDTTCLRSNPSLQGKAIPSAYYDPELLTFYLQNGNVASVQTKRGCTHRCSYCSYPVLEGPTIRAREPGAIVDDIINLTGPLGAEYIFFTDSVFNDDEGRFLEVLHEMERRKVCVPWTAFIKPGGHLDDEMVALMKRTGLKAAELGSDAATDVTLAGMHKGFSFKDIADVNDLFLDHEIATAHYFMFGGPGETTETVLEGIENIKSLRKTAIFIFMGIRILPDTGLASIALRDGVITADQDLLEPAYYLAPGLDQAWLEATLTKAFESIRHCVFPPDALDSSLRFLHKLGYSGSLWDLLSKDRRRRHGKTT